MGRGKPRVIERPASWRRCGSDLEGITYLRVMEMTRQVTRQAKEMRCETIQCQIEDGWAQNRERRN
jgi:hypothetical protein